MYLDHWAILQGTLQLSSAPCWYLLDCTSGNVTPLQTTQKLLNKISSMQTYIFIKKQHFLAQFSLTLVLYCSPQFLQYLSIVMHGYCHSMVNKTKQKHSLSILKLLPPSSRQPKFSEIFFTFHKPLFRLTWLLDNISLSFN